MPSPDYPRLREILGEPRFKRLMDLPPDKVSGIRPVAVLQHRLDGTLVRTGSLARNSKDDADRLIAACDKMLRGEY